MNTFARLVGWLAMVVFFGFSLVGVGQCGVDADHDGYIMCTSAMDPTNGSCDCNDADDSVYPYGYELCNSLDDNCNGVIDEWQYLSPYAEGTVNWSEDADGDGYGEMATTEICLISTEGYVDNSLDCDDANPAIYSGATEICNGINDDCDWYTDEVYNFYLDGDGDGYGDVRFLYFGCLSLQGWVLNSADCNDAEAIIYPGAVEICDSKDNDCDGTAEEGLTITSCPTMATDDDGDVYYEDSHDCDDTNQYIYPSAVENYMDGIDTDCDGVADEIPDGIKIYYFDADGDGYGSYADSSVITNSPTSSAYAHLSGDCNDANPQKYPGNGC